MWYRLGLRKVPPDEPCWPLLAPLLLLVLFVAVLEAVAVVPVSPRRVFSSSLQVGWPPLLEESTSETPLSAGEGGKEPGDGREGKGNDQLTGFNFSSFYDKFPCHNLR